MDKNTLTGFILIALVLIGFSWYTKPSDEEIAAKMKQDSIAAVKAEEAKNRADAAKTAKASEQAKAAAMLQDSAAASAKAENIVLKNDKVELTLSTKGGTVQKAVIKGYKDMENKGDVVLFDKDEQQLSYMLAAKTVNINTADLVFAASNKSDSTVTLTASVNGGGKIVFDYSLNNNYLLGLSLKAEGMSGQFAPDYKKLSINWKDHLRQQERGFTFENRYSNLTYHYTEGGTDKLSEAGNYTDEPQDDEDETIDWIAFKNQFFSAVMITGTDFGKDGKFTSLCEDKGSKYLKNYEASVKTDFDPTGAKPTELEFYYGPNDFRLLKDMNDESKFAEAKDLELHKLIYLGWPLVRLINRWFTIYVFDWLTSMGIPMGIVILIITLLLKLITFPMVKKSYMSSAKMRVLKPKLDEATKKYDKPEDAMMKQQAMMQMYQEYGVSPLSGCLPMLIQMPIWIAMFNFVPNAIQLRRESFLWMDDLSTYDPIIEWGTNIWLIGDHLSLTCILFCVGNLLYSWMTMRQQKDQMVGQQADQMKMMQWMMMLMPLMFFFMFNDYSSGLNFYYFISLFFSAAIMWTLRKTTNDAKLLAYLEARKAERKANPQKMSGMAKRLAELQKQAEEMQRQKENGWKK
ncbi:MAG: membrane protein insertase YidC [Bacteroidaceae bacterium]|nr:membrane protein insertase YidC [Bacteroidaceae bacterium]